MKLGELIVQYRQEHGLSQREFARRCELSNSLISIIEKGVNPQTGKEMSPDLETYHRLAVAMGMSVQALFEKLGDDATVRLVTLRGFGEPDPDYSEDDNPKKTEKVRMLMQNISQLDEEEVDQLNDMFYVLFSKKFRKGTENQ